MNKPNEYQQDTEAMVYVGDEVKCICFQSWNFI